MKECVLGSADFGVPLNYFQFTGGYVHSSVIANQFYVQDSGGNVVGEPVEARAVSFLIFVNTFSCLVGPLLPLLVTSQNQVSKLALNY